MQNATFNLLLRSQNLLIGPLQSSGKIQVVIAWAMPSYRATEKQICFYPSTCLDAKTKVTVVKMTTCCMLIGPLTIQISSGVLLVGHLKYEGLN